MKEQLKKADVLGLVLIASALISYFIRGNWTYYQTGVVVAGALLVVVALILKAGEIRTGLGRRSTKFGINSGISVLLFVGVLALVNYLGEQNQKRVDMTTERLHSLGDESVKVLAELKENVQVKAFFPLPEEPQLRDLLELYSHENDNIGLEFIDPDKQPLLAKKYEVSQYGRRVNPFTGQQTSFGTVILEKADGRVERIEKQDDVTEEDVTNALLKLVKGQEKTVYFVEGHGEKAIDSTENTGYQVANTALTRDRYAVKTLNLVREEKVPADASVVVMAGPVREPLPQEMEKLEAYLNEGGSVLLMLDPPPSGASLMDFTQKWSVDIGNNRVIDLSTAGQLLGGGPASPLVTRYPDHKIVERFNLMTFYPLARSVTPAKEPAAGLTVEPLIETADESWGWHDLAATEVEVGAFDPKVDIKGPVPIAAVVSKDIADGKTARLAVFGDSDFARNDVFAALGNGNLFVNTVKWLARDENFISIKTKSPADRPLTLSESAGRTVGILLVFIFPGAVLFSGILVWMKRRK
jgi:ABC-type uncharacterized transport system involved in gliding motility auxiliary subunit